MNDTDKLIAAIFSAGLCSSRQLGQDEYFKVYEEFVEIMKTRELERGKKDFEAWMSAVKSK